MRFRSNLPAEACIDFQYVPQVGPFEDHVFIFGKLENICECHEIFFALWPWVFLNTVAKWLPCEAAFTKAW